MGTIDSKNIWEIDTIDRILAYSKRKENAFKFFKFDFQIASFSIQKTLKIYSDKVKMLSASTKDFWKILLNDRALIIKKNSTSKKVLKINSKRNIETIFHLKVSVWKKYNTLQIQEIFFRSICSNNRFE